MTLSAELFNQICEALKSDKGSEREKRASPRVGLRAQVEILLKPGTRTPPVLMRVRDLSASGIGLVYSKELAVGAEFVARMPGGLDGPVHISCIVAYCRKVASDTYSIGGRIVRVLSPEEATMLAAKAL